VVNAAWERPRHSCEIAHHTVSHQGCDASFLHSGTKDVAEDAGVGHAHRVDPARHPSGIASIAVRVEIGDDQDPGVARSWGSSSKVAATLQAD
jgi:hypothetical protein